jgi:hypothetical protein
MDADILALVRRENPWLERQEAWKPSVRAHLPATYVPRSAPRLADLLGSKAGASIAVLIIGPRQAGKSTWVWKQLEALPARVLFLDCEVRRFRAWCTDPGAFLADLAGLVTRPAAIFLEEAQHLDDAALFVKGLVDRRVPCPVLVTGSSSFHLQSRSRESLAGRARRIRIFPFSLEEVCGGLGKLAPLLRRSATRERLERHAARGGYPAAWQSTEPAGELAALVDAFVLRDASDLFRIERPDAFRTLLGLAARQVGSPVRLSEWASFTSLSVSTVSAYLGILEESHILARTPVFHGGRRAELTSSPKLYFVDCGLRNLLVDDLRPLGERADAGPLLENWVLGELHKGLPDDCQVSWWRTKSGAEVDFVVQRGEELVAIEVKAERTPRLGLSRGARSFLEAYAPKRLLVANLGLEQATEIAGCAVEWLHAADVLERVRSALALG